MSNIIDAYCDFHLGDNIINFIFFYKMKEYIEANNIIIHYYCHEQYHKNLLEFNCSNNIKIFNHNHTGFHLWQANTQKRDYIEDTLCQLFKDFFKLNNIPLTIDSFEYQDNDLFKRFFKLEDKYKNLDILIINSQPHSGQYHYDKNIWDSFIVKLSNKYKLATSEKVNDEIISLHDFSVKNIAAIALNVKIIITINTGPSIPLYNTDILNNVDVIYMFDKGCYEFKTKKIKVMQNIEHLSFLLEDK
jgi:hypothetical protein